MDRSSRALFILVALLIVLELSLARPLAAQVSYYPDSPEVQELRRLYAEARAVLPSTSFPLSRHSLALYARALQEQSSDEVVQERLERFLHRLDYRPGSFELSLLNRFSLEGYLRAGEPWVDFEHEYLEKADLWRLDMALSRDDKMAVAARGFIHREYWGLSDWNLPANVSSSNRVATENRNISKGILWYNFDPLQMVFGRDRVHVGPLRSSLLFSSRLPFLDMLRLSLPIGPLHMELIVSTLENREAVDDLDLTALTSDVYKFRENLIFANLHRFEYDFGFLRAAVSGLCLYVRPQNAFVLADFFPVFSWHSGDIRPNNLSLIFDVEAAIFPGFRLMAQFGFDDINSESIGAGGDTDIPTIHAGILGFEYTRRLPFADLALYGECGYTHYLWGNFNNEEALARAIYRLALDGKDPYGTQILPLTSPFGPGAVWAMAELSLARDAVWRAALDAELVFDNPAADLVDTLYEVSETVKDTAKEYTLSLGAELRYAPLRWLELYTEPTLFLRRNQTWFELELGGTASLDYVRRLGRPSP